MNTCPVDLDRLWLVVQRLLDAEVLLDADGAALMRATEAARRALAAGDAEAARRHVEEVARSVDALVSAQTLDRAGGRAVLEATRRLLGADTA